MASRRKDGGVSAPIFLGGLFPDSDASDQEGEGDFENQAENQVITIGDMQLTIRQYGYHQANANQVWPGTFIIADFMLAERERYSGAPLLELGSATGALAIYLRRLQQNFQVVTSDIDDGGEVAENVAFNSVQNGLAEGVHVPHTWGTGWSKCVDKQPQQVRAQLQGGFKFVVASDILLYVSAYPALVQTLAELFGAVGDAPGVDAGTAEREAAPLASTSGLAGQPVGVADAGAGTEDVRAEIDVGEGGGAGAETGAVGVGGASEFLMAWNRRISASGQFFDLMQAAGFRCHHHGKCVYSFFTQHSARGDAYLQELLLRPQEGARPA